MKWKPFWRLPVLVTLGVLFAFSAYQVGSHLLRARAEDAAFSALSDAVSAHTTEPPEAAATEESSVEPAPSPYQFLKEQNPDFWGWPTIPETKLDYPVMYTPEEPEYYLRRAFDGSSSLSGVPFVGEGYREDGRHTIIYGHNMKNGTMFATLLSYADRAFWREHPAITLDTLDGSRTYQVLGAFYSKAFLQTEEDVFRFYQCSDLSARDAFESYVEQVRDAALYDTGVTAEYEGELLTLATCSYHAKNGRFVVVGYRDGLPT